MITEQEIKNLAALARLELSVAEQTRLQHDLAIILDYVSDLKSAPASKGEEPEYCKNLNQLRVDGEPEPGGSGQSWVKVKKIL